MATLAVSMLAGTVTLASAAAGGEAPRRPSGLAKQQRSAAETAIARANDALTAHRAELAVSDDDKVTAFRTVVDDNGASHVRYTRSYKGLRVYGGDFVVHNNPDGSYAGASVSLVQPLSLTTRPKMASNIVLAKARTAFKGTVASVDTPTLVVDASSGQGRLAYETVVRGTAPDGQTPSVLHVLTDAATGAVLGADDEIATVDGTGNSLYAGTVTLSTTKTGSTYTLIDPTHGNGATCDMNNTMTTCTMMNDANNVWGNGSITSDQSAAVDAHYGAAKTFDYYKNVRKRNGIFGNGVGVPSRVHFGNEYVNAFWDGAQMTYGDGPSNALPLVALDVAAHEMTHGVTENVIPNGLLYFGEAGGLNESTSDIFGSMVEFYANNATDPGDYLIGEQLNLYGNGSPLRWMYNPPLDNASYGCWSSGIGADDVHLTSGVGNHFFFMLAEGSGSTPYGTSPVCGGASAVTGIGRDAASAIWFRALDIYFTASTSYVDATNPGNTARAYTLAAATDLYGLCSKQYKAVQSAWTAVNVDGVDQSCAVNDFSLTLAPASAALSPGTSVTATVSTAVVAGSAQAVSFSASGLPAGATASFSPVTATTGTSSTMTIKTSASTPPGTYAVTITGTGSGATRTQTYVLTVYGSTPACSTTNGTDVPIPNPGVTTSSIAISGCAGIASATARVEVHIVHSYRGDLVVSLIAPDDSTYVLFDAADSDASVNLNATFTADLSSELADGTWRLQVEDIYPLDSGTIDSWTLNLGPAPATPGSFVSLDPSRILDTRTGNGAPVGKLGPKKILDLQVTGRGGVPSAGVAAVVMNVTVTSVEASGYLTVFPTGTSAPTASNLNFVAGTTVPNLVMVKLGTGGKASFKNGSSTGSTHVVADVAGYYLSGTPTSAGTFVSLNPSRIMDTRSGNGAPVGKVAAHGIIDLQVTGRGGVPASGVAAVVMNVTVTATEGSGYLTVFPKGTSAPTASNLNFTAGQTIPNLVVVKLGSGGKVSLKNGSSGATHLVADVAGYYRSGTATLPGTFVPLNPSRIMDTRTGTGTPVGKLSSMALLDLEVNGRGGVPSSGVAALVTNVTVTAPTSSGYITVFPTGTVAPTASNLNFRAGKTVPNLVIVKLGAGGKVTFKNGSSGTTHLVADVAGYFLS